VRANNVSCVHGATEGQGGSACVQTTCRACMAPQRTRRQRVRVNNVSCVHGATEDKAAARACKQRVVRAWRMSNHEDLKCIHSV
jgi:hypothetical protein